jgi:uncharacterized membrane protein YesL
MPLFGYRLDKPGKGVDPNAPPKHPFLLFWELLFRKISKYVLLNMMYLAVILPIVIVAYGAFYGWVLSVGAVEEEMVVSLILDLFGSIVNFVPSVLHLPLLTLSLILYGPFTAGLTYILRNYAREEHAFISDFFTKARENRLQGFIFGMLDILVCVILWVNLNYIALVGADSAGLVLFGTAIKYLSVVLFVIYFFMRFYIYQMVVTAELSVRAIIKNAWIFAFLGLGRNIIATVAIAASLILFFFVHPLIEVITVPFIAFSFCCFIGVFTTYPIIEKYIVKPVRDAEKKEDDEEIEKKLGGRGGELPPELGGPGAGSLHVSDEDK